jgi:hypothetical protein
MSKLYSYINSNLTNEATLEEEGQAQTVVSATPHRLYTLLVPEKPAILAEERIFVYVPKVSYDHAGIAKFAAEHFNIVNGTVSIKPEVLTSGQSRGVFFPEDLPEEEDRYINLVLFDTN